MPRAELLVLFWMLEKVLRMLSQFTKDLLFLTRLRAVMWLAAMSLARCSCCFVVCCTASFTDGQCCQHDPHGRFLFLRTTAIVVR